MSGSTLKTVLKQVKRYKSVGYGAGGSLLKHSLYPLKYLVKMLPNSGLILDLGCGEGMLTNLLAARLSGAEFRGIDIDKDKIDKASKVACPNAHFSDQDILQAKFNGASAAIFNDVLHHHPDEAQKKLIDVAAKFLDEDGLLILKEVDRKDRIDVAWTGLMDRKLYPKDTLNFKTVKEWTVILKKAGFRVIDIHKVRHPWPASRTMIVATKKPKLQRIKIEELSEHEKQSALKVLVTGATGFIGEHLVRELITSGIGGKKVVITVIARDPDVLAADLKGSSRVKIISEDLTNLSGKSRLFEEYDYVFHLASKVDFFGGKKIIDENVNGTKNLLAEIPRGMLKRFIFTSTMGALDRSKSDDCSSSLDENSSAYPVSFYGESKLEGERVVRGSGLPYTIIRVPWCYGPGMSKTHHVRVLFEKVMKGSIAVKINWPGRVSIIEVGELSRILREVCLIEKAKNDTFFVSDGDPIRFGDLFREMGRIAGKKAGSVSMPSIFWWFAKLFRVFVPFQLKSLFLDVLSVSNNKIKSIGQDIKPREQGFLLPLARYINEQRYPSRFRSIALITGAASGIGAALAKKLYASGYSLLLLDNDEAPLKSIAAKLSAQYLNYDLSNESIWSNLYENLKEKMNRIEIVINNAGVGARGDLGSLEESTIEKMIRVNCLAPARMIRMFVPVLSKTRRGSIINIASSSAFQPLPYMAVYCASKSFLLNFSEAVSGEIPNENDSNYEVITVSPSGTATGFQSRSGVKRSANERLLDPDDVASAISRYIGKGSRSVIIGRSGKMMSLLARVLPRSIQIWLWKRLMEKMR